jgi:hypothetical protein
MPALEFAAGRALPANGTGIMIGKTCRASPKRSGSSWKPRPETPDLTGHSSLDTDTDRQIGMQTARAHTSDSGVAIRVDRHVEAQLPGRGRMTDAMGKMMAARKDSSIVGKPVVTSVETSELNFL